MSKQPPVNGQPPVSNDPTTGLFVSKLTEDVMEKIVEAIRGQSAPETACVRANVHVRTFRRWLADGRAWLEQHTEDEIPVPEAVFAANVERAMADARDALERGVATNDDWRAKHQILVARYPREFGKRERLDIGNPDGEEFRIAGRDLSMLTLEDKLELRRILALIAEGERGADVIDMPLRRHELGPG